MVPIENALFIVGAWVFWGTYPVPFKSPAAQKANTDPFAFQFMKSSCVCITSWLILTWRPFAFTYWGFVGAALWIPSGLFFITAVKLTGLAFATPTANGVQVIVSFCWGAFFFKETVHSVGLSVLALFIMIIGMIGISISTNWEKMRLAKLAKQHQSASVPYNDTMSINVKVGSETSPLLSNTPKQQRRSFGQQPQQSQQQSQQQPEQPQQQPLTKSEERRRFILGIICAMTGGLFGGTQNVPLKHAPPKAHGIEYVISFGIGAVLVISVFTAVYTCIRLATKQGLPTVNLRLSLLPGTIAGLLWSAGNICNIYATLAYGQTVGFPLVMCNMMVAGFWGVFYYNEAPNIWMKVLFIFSCATLLGGVTLLSVFG